MVTDLVSSERSTILSTLEQKRRSQNRQTVIRKYQVQNNQTVQKNLPKWNSNNNMPSSQKAPLPTSLRKYARL